MSSPTYFRRQEAISISENRLPHWEQDDATYFLTFRLADSLPSGLLAQWREEREQWMRHNPQPWNPVQEAEYHEVFSRKKERWLDAGHGACPLADPAVRMSVREAIFAQQTGVNVWSLVIMPNHAHVLLSLSGARPLAHVLKTWKGTSARAANLARNSSGSFWGKDYFDRMIRDEAHFWNCARYIRRNPEKAGLSQNGFSLMESAFVRNTLDGSSP